MSDLNSDLNSDFNADYAIDLKTAQTYAARWRDPATTFDYRGTHAFFIPTDNLQALLDQKPADAIGVRAYIGIDDNKQAKLMIVGTIPYRAGTDVHDDMLPDSIGSVPVGKIYDFTRPCPPVCAHVSSLNDLP